jgi:hypothetical protein
MRLEVHESISPARTVISVLFVEFIHSNYATTIGCNTEPKVMFSKYTSATGLSFVTKLWVLELNQREVNRLHGLE